MLGVCVDPQAVPAGALAAYALDPSGDTQITQHLTICAACAKEVAAMQALHEHLTSRLTRFDCPPAEQIDAFAAGALPPSARAAVNAHVQSCARCTEEVRLAAQFLSEADPLLDWHAAGIMARLRRVLATLQAPAPGASPALALRGTQANSPLTYVAEDVTLTLRYIHDQSPRLLGFIDVAAEPAVIEQPFSVRLLKLATDDETGPVPVAQSEAEDGAFELAPTPAGTYTLEVDLPDRQVVIEGIVLG